MRVVCPHCLSVNNIPQKESYKKANCGKCKNSLLDTKPIELSEANFDEVVVNSDIPVIVDYWAPWCGPCKNFAPVYEQISEEIDGIIFAKVDTEAEQNIAAKFQIRSIPTLMIFREQIIIFTQPGMMSANNLKEVIEKAKGLNMADVKKKIAKKST